MLQPVQRVNAGVFAPAFGEQLELAIHPLDVRRKHHALIAVTLGSGGNNGRVLDGTGVDTYFVGTAFQHPVKIFQAADAAADRQRDKNFAGNAAQNIGKIVRPSTLAVIS